MFGSVSSCCWDCCGFAVMSVTGADVISCNLQSSVHAGVFLKCIELLDDMSCWL